MRRKVILLCVLILQVCTIVSCKSKDDKDMKPIIEFYNAVAKVVSNEPLFTSDDIEYYDWSTHTIVFKEGFIDKYKDINSNNKDINSDNKDINSDNKDISTDFNSATEVTLIFDENMAMDSNGIGGSRIFGTGSKDKFMIYVDSEFIYDGYYNQSIYSSFFPIGAVMVERSDGIRIDFNPMEGIEDNRSDIRIYNALESLEILKD